MTSRLKDLSVDFVSLVPRGADQDAHVVLAKSADADPSAPGAPAVKEGPVPETKTEKAELPEAVAKALEGVELTDEAREGLAAVIADLAPAPVADEPTETDPEGDEPTGEPAPADVTKSAEYVALQKEVQDLRTERDIERTVAEVRKTYDSLPTSPEEFGAALYRVRKGEPTEGDLSLLEQVLAGANSAIQANALMTRELGTAVPAEDSPEGSIEKIAKGLQAQDPKLTAEQAYAQALNSPEGKQAYAQAMAERPAVAVND